MRDLRAGPGRASRPTGAAVYEEMTLVNDSMDTSASPSAELCELLRTREAVYRMFSFVYFKELSDEQIRFLAAEGLPMLEGLEGTVGEGARTARRFLSRITSATREDLAVDYAHTFLAAGSTKGEQRACPFESIYTTRDGLMMGAPRDRVYKYMLDEHLTPDESLHVPEDHLSFEFDFMAALCGRMAEAAEADDLVEARRLLGVQRAFHREHQLNWIDGYRDVIDGCCRTDFYRGFAAITAGFVHMESDLIDETERLLDGLGEGADASGSAEG